MSKAQDKFNKIMAEWEKGTLRDSHGTLIKHPKEFQRALAVAFSESRRIDAKFKMDQAPVKKQDGGYTEKIMLEVDGDKISLEDFIKVNTAPDVEPPSEEDMTIIKNLKVGESYFTGHAGSIEIKRIMQNGGDIDLEAVKLKYAIEDIDLLEQEGDMAITDTKYGVLWGDHKDGVFEFNTKDFKNKFRGNKAEAVEFLKNAFTVEEMEQGGIAGWLNRRRPYGKMDYIINGKKYKLIDLIRLHKGISLDEFLNRVKNGKELTEKDREWLTMFYNDNPDWMIKVKEFEDGGKTGDELDILNIYLRCQIYGTIDKSMSFEKFVYYLRNTGYYIEIQNEKDHPVFYSYTENDFNENAFVGKQNFIKFKPKLIGNSYINITKQQALALISLKDMKLIENGGKTSVETSWDYDVDQMFDKVSTIFVHEKNENADVLDRMYAITKKTAYKETLDEFAKEAQKLKLDSVKESILAVVKNIKAGKYKNEFRFTYGGKAGDISKVSSASSFFNQFRQAYDYIGKMKHGGKMATKDGVGEKKNTEVILTENRSNGAKWKGVVKPFMLKSIEENQYKGGFKRYAIDIYDEVKREPTKEEIQGANEFFDKVGGRYSSGGSMENGGKNKDKNKTKVIFLYNEANDDLFAYFPDEIHHGNMRVSYSHVGQHSSADPEYAIDSRQATLEEYKDLKSELESLGYNLSIVNKSDIMADGGKVKDLNIWQSEKDETYQWKMNYNGHKIEGVIEVKKSQHMGPASSIPRSPIYHEVNIEHVEGTPEAEIIYESEKEYIKQAILDKINTGKIEKIKQNGGRTIGDILLKDEGDFYYIYGETEKGKKWMKDNNYRDGQAISLEDMNYVRIAKGINVEEFKHGGVVENTASTFAEAKKMIAKAKNLSESEIRSAGHSSKLKSYLSSDSNRIFSFYNKDGNRFLGSWVEGSNTLHIFEDGGKTKESKTIENNNMEQQEWMEIWYIEGANSGAISNISTSIGAAQKALAAHNHNLIGKHGLGSIHKARVLKKDWDADKINVSNLKQYQRELSYSGPVFQDGGTIDPEKKRLEDRIKALELAISSPTTAKEMIANFQKSLEKVKAQLKDYKSAPVEEYASERTESRGSGTRAKVVVDVDSQSALDKADKITISVKAEGSKPEVREIKTESKTEKPSSAPREKTSTTPSVAGNFYIDIPDKYYGPMRNVLYNEKKEENIKSYKVKTFDNKNRVFLESSGDLDLIFKAYNEKREKKGDPKAIKSDITGTAPKMKNGGRTKNFSPVKKRVERKSVKKNLAKRQSSVKGKL